MRNSVQMSRFYLSSVLKKEFQIGNEWICGKKWYIIREMNRMNVGIISNSFLGRYSEEKTLAQQQNKWKIQDQYVQ